MSSHFDTIKDYDAQIPSHIRDYLVKKKTSLTEQQIKTHLPLGSDFKTRILDLGCGTGWHMKELSQYIDSDIHGIDISVSQVKNAKINMSNSDILCADLLNLPYEDNYFDCVYSINTIHHLLSIEDQKTAFQSIERVLKPNGIFILHEINVTNPIIRFYMDYIFPKLRDIDTGEENWILPKNFIELLPGTFSLKSLIYYTFLPDFTPRCAMGGMLMLEKILEKSIMKKHSAHYMACWQIEKPAANFA